MNSNAKQTGIIHRMILQPKQNPKSKAVTIVTPDGTRLQSKHRYDYISYTDKNGKEYFVDYDRYGAEDLEDLIVIPPE